MRYNAEADIAIFQEALDAPKSSVTPSARDAMQYARLAITVFDRVSESHAEKVVQAAKALRQEVPISSNKGVIYQRGTTMELNLQRFARVARPVFPDFPYPDPDLFHEDSFFLQIA